MEPSQLQRSADQRLGRARCAGSRGQTMKMHIEREVPKVPKPRRPSKQPAVRASAPCPAPRFDFAKIPIHAPSEPVNARNPAFTAEHVLALQRTIGNRAVNALRYGPASWPDAGDAVQRKAVDAGYGDIVAAAAARGTGPKTSADQGTASAEPAGAAQSEGAAQIDPAAAELVTRARGGGARLDTALQSQLEAALGVQLDRVRVHTSSQADAAAGVLGAQAFAISDDMFFRAGAYEPQQRAGQWLIAHEVAHTVQTRSAAMPAGGAVTVSRPDDAPEREADAFADAFVRDTGVDRGEPVASRRGGAPESAHTATARIKSAPVLKERAASRIQLHPVEKVLKYAAKWLAKRETKTLSKHIARHARRIAGRAIHSVFKHPKKIKSLVEGTVREATELAAKHATTPISEAIEEGGIRVIRQATGTPGKVRWVVQKTFRDAIGMSGERILRIIIDQSGRIVSAFPSDRLVAIGLSVGAAGILGERSADAAAKAHMYAEHDAAKEDSWSFWDFVPFVGDIWGGDLNAGEDAELHRQDELAKDIQDVIMAVETEEGRNLTRDERMVVEETFRAAIGATLIEPDESLQ